LFATVQHREVELVALRRVGPRSAARLIFDGVSGRPLNAGGVAAARPFPPLLVFMENLFTASDLTRAAM
jgi:hypothetical protein